MKSEKDIDKLIASQRPDLVLKMHDNENEKKRNLGLLSEILKLFIFTFALSFLCAFVLGIFLFSKIPDIPTMKYLFDVVYEPILGASFVFYGIAVYVRRRGEHVESDGVGTMQRILYMYGNSAKILGTLYIICGLVLFGIFLF